VSLCSNQWLLSGGRSTSGTYRPTRTNLILTDFQRVAMDVGNNGADVHSVIPDLGNDRNGMRDVVTNFRSGSMGIRDTMTDVGGDV